MMYPWLDGLVADGERHLAEAVGLTAMIYLRSRGVAPAEARAHRLGWYPLNYHVPACPVSFVPWQQGYLRQRLVFPITSTLNEPIGLQSRALADKQYQIYYAGSRDVYAPLFGLGQAADLMYEREQVVVVEGTFDYFAVRRAGVENVVALMTAKASLNVVRLLSRYCRRVFALLDMDTTGRDGITTLLHGGFEVVAPVYPAHDPADLATTPAGLTLLGQLVAPAQERYALWV